MAEIKMGANKMLALMQDLLILTPTNYMVALKELNAKLTKYLREKRGKGDEYRYDTPDWDRYPIARTWYCQN